MQGVSHNIKQVDTHRIKMPILFTHRFNEILKLIFKTAYLSCLINKQSAHDYASIIHIHRNGDIFMSHQILKLVV